MKQLRKTFSPLLKKVHGQALWRRPTVFSPLLVFLLLGASLLPGAVYAQEPEQAVTAAATTAPAWLEPRGLSVVDLVGVVPEEHLVDTIITSRVGTGILQYISGKREGDTVTVNARVHPRYWTDGTSSATTFGCLSKPAIADEWPIALPPSSMRLYEDGKEITSEVLVSPMDYVSAGQILPGNSGKDWWRYDFNWGQKTVFNSDGSVAVPASMGCAYNISGRRTNLTAKFVINTPNYLAVEVKGQQDFTFYSYIGVGGAGHIDGLRNQLTRRFGDRHDKFDLTIPAGADYLLVKYPPTPVDPYMGQPEINIFWPTSGSYRLSGPNNTLSVDHVSSMGVPIYGQWQDADQSGGDYLRFFSNVQRLASPEYFVPAGVPYDGCMVQGNCSDTLLDKIHDTPMSMTVYYYRVARIRDGLTRIPLKQVGPDWSSSRAAGADTAASAPVADQPTAATAMAGGEDVLYYLPLVFTAEPKPQELPEGDNNGCPCGWFDGYGRMFDYIPPAP
jgi:hypothetical protein